jgi:hypothetical protein
MTRIVRKLSAHDGANRPLFVRLFGAFGPVKFSNNHFHSGTALRLCPL